MSEEYKQLGYYLRNWLINEFIYFIGVWVNEHKGNYPKWLLYYEPLAKLKGNYDFE